ncbi:coiled-coil domain-containing protein 61-like [Dendronephthya gigantea]|uniref:coiled-coil domain-containing protein 61-like n=1 Tax=Dendronephthya gigantea TaxID=151771 RepID=UPI00106B7E4A|nr:coiled-coil domain-containing protein 61-like [Dendronephthya gigantea]XP_028396332.1 coiled-coil domain-containing protein 61-like [Dendronephthya gigantea]
MSDAGKMPSLSARHVFRGIEYIVSMFVRDEVVIVEAEDRLTADQWRAEFDARYIEDLTHKTGNFKQFKVFVNMIESALNKDSPSVSLDLLTYADLQSLREQKPGTGVTNIPGARSTSQLSTKRYLILTYTVEFDRIHYPLPLPYVGKPDPVHLQDMNRKLKDEIKNLKNQLTKEAQSYQAEKKQKQLDNLLNEKENVEKEFNAFQREVKHSSLADTAKEIRVLKKVIKNLEGELLKEKTKYQKMLSKKSQENRDLLQELKEARGNERNLRARCRNLTNELALLKRQGAKIRQSPSAGSVPRTSSAKKTNYIPRRTASKERKVTPQSRRRTRSPSPSAANVPRFDPTAYVKEKQRKLKEARESRSRSRTRSGSKPILRKRSVSSDRGSPREPRARRQDGNRIYRTSSLSSIGSRRSSGSIGRPEYNERTRKRSGSRDRRDRAPSYGSSVEGSDAERGKKYFRKMYSSTPQDLKRATISRKGGKRHDNSLNRSVEISEIDARLNALQQYMKENMN